MCVAALHRPRLCKYGFMANVICTIVTDYFCHWLYDCFLLFSFFLFVSALCMCIASVFKNVGFFCVVFLFCFWGPGLSKSASETGSFSLLFSLWWCCYVMAGNYDEANANGKCIYGIVVVENQENRNEMKWDETWFLVLWLGLVGAVVVGGREVGRWWERARWWESCKKTTLECCRLWKWRLVNLKNSIQRVI